MKKKVIIVIAIGVVVLSIIFVLGGVLIFKKAYKRIKPVEGIAGFETYVSKEIGVSFKYPSNWIIDKSDDNKDRAQVMFRGPGTNKTPFRVRFVVFRRSEMYSNDFYKDIKKTIKVPRDFTDVLIIKAKKWEDGENVKIHFRKLSKLADSKADWIRYSYDDKVAARAYGDAMNKSLAHTVSEDIITKKDNGFYSISFTFQGDEKYYDKYYEAFLKAKESFKFLD